MPAFCVPTREFCVSAALFLFAAIQLIHFEGAFSRQQQKTNTKHNTHNKNIRAMPEPGFLTRLDHGQELRVFEKPPVYHKENALFAHLISSTIDWCERNYAVTKYIAEFYNTVSNGVMIFISVWLMLHVVARGLERRFLVPSVGFFTIAIGSLQFHAHLSAGAQFADEWPMMISITAWIWILLCIDPKDEAHPTKKRFFTALAYFFAIFTLCYGAVHWYVRFVALHQTIFAVLMVVTITLVLRECHVSGTRSGGARLGHVYVGSLVTACVCWLLDNIFCEELHDLRLFGVPLPNPQLHAWWHVWTAIASFTGTLFLIFQRSFHLGEAPWLAWRFGVLPYVVRGRVVARGK